LLAHDARGLVFEKVLEFLKAKGWLKAKGKQRTDATHIIGQVQRLSVFELKWESLRMVLSDLLGRDAKWVLAQVAARVTTTYSTSRNTYHLSQSELKQLEKQVDSDLLDLLQRLDAVAAEDLRTLTYVRLL
jgi:transposase